MNRWSFPALALFAAGCTCGAFDPNTTRFACSSDGDCGEGFVCGVGPGGRECVAADAGTSGGGSGGGTGGASGGGTGGGNGGGTGGGFTGGGGGDVGGGAGGGTGGGATGGGTGGGVIGGGTGGGITGGGTGGGVTGGGTGGGLIGGGTGGGTGGGAVVVGGGTGGSGGGTGGSGAGTGGGSGAGTGGGSGAGTGGGGAGMGGGTGGGTGGGSSGPADRLAFTNPVQTLQTGICSNALTVETRNASNQRTNVLLTTAVTFSATGAGATSIAFFTDPQCLTAPNSTIQIPAGSASGSIYFRASQAGMPTIQASAFTLMSALQLQNVVNAPNMLVFTTLAPTPPLLAGQCFLATVESRFNGTVTSVLSDSTVSLQSVPATALRYFSNATCTTGIGSVTIPSGQSRASFYVKPISGGSDTVTAIASFGTAQLQLTVQGVVRKGLCSMTSLQTSVSCPVSPPQQSIARTMLVYQGVSSADQSGANEVKCRLTAPDLITCERPDGGNVATIQWQTAELVSGLNVQRSSASSCTPTVPLPIPVNPSSSFVLSSFSGVGTNYDGDDMSAAILSGDGGVVAIDNRDPMLCTGFEFQVVELSGISTVRGTVPGMTFGQRTLNTVVLPAASPNSIVLNQSLLGSSIPSNTPLCPLMVRSQIDTPTSLMFSRGTSGGSLSCSQVPVTELVWERVDFGSRGGVQTFAVDLQSNSFNVPIGQVDVSRTLVFAGGQQAGGQASGETDYNSNSGWVGVATARFDLNSPSSVRVTRGRSTGDATITMYVLELEP